MSTYRFQLREGYKRCQVAVQELSDDVILEGDQVFETTSASVAAELDDQPALKRAAAAVSKSKSEKE